MFSVITPKVGNSTNWEEVTLNEIHESFEEPNRKQIEK
jgi:hypothetical protein